DAIPTATTRWTSRIRIDTFTVIRVIVIDHIPIVDHELRRAFGPDIDGAACQRFAFPRDQRLAVSAMRNEIVLPRKVVETLTHKAAIGTKVFARIFALWSRDDSKSFCLVRLEVSLKDQHVG